MTVTETVGVVVFKGGAVLLVRHGEGAKHKTGAVGLPAGKVEHGEGAPEAAARELYEETGLTVAAGDLLQLPETYTATIELKQGPKTFHWTVFLARAVSGTPRGPTAETEPFWFPLSKLEDKNLIVNVNDAIEQARTFA